MSTPPAEQLLELPPHTPSSADTQAQTQTGRHTVSPVTAILAFAIKPYSPRLRWNVFRVWV